MATESQVSKILQILFAGKDAYKRILELSAEEIAEASVDELQRDLKRLYGSSALISDEARADVINKLVGRYAESIRRGGSMCVERILTKQGTGFLATTQERFVPWLSDMADKEAADVMATITKMETEGVHPRKIASAIREQFKGTEHNALTAARTEASKIRNDARWQTMKKQGYQYLKYVTAGDDRVRPEHAMRDEKIYPINNAPFIGEFNCRCLLVPADYEVEINGADVTQSEAEYLTKEQAGL